MEGMDRTTVFVYDPWRAGLQGARSTNALQRSTSCRYYRTVHYDTDSNGQYPDYNLNLWCGCCNRKVKNRHKDSSSSKVWFECGVYCIRGVYFVPIYIIYIWYVVFPQTEEGKGKKSAATKPLEPVWFCI